VSFEGVGMLIMLAPITRETPAAIEKNTVAEEMSRMRGRGLEAHYSMSRASRGERNSPLQGWLDLKAPTLKALLGAAGTIPGLSCLEAFERWELGL
jgi:hypothetical protein